MNCKRAKLLSALLLSAFTTLSLYASGLKTAAPVVKMKPIMTVEYEYSKSGRITARKINGQVQNYKYDKKGQLLGVYDGKGNAVEEYVYDPAGNILKKTVQGKTTTYKYDKANQLVSSECNGKVTKYEYDAAGRLVKEGDKEYHYIGLDKIESVTENGRRLSSFTYHIDGQLAARVSIESSEEFQWDGLALIQRNSTNYVNEPAVTGGNPILADDKVLFNDMLGTTLGVKDGDKVMQNNLTAFGESLSTSPMQDSFFTGKPHVGEMGYVFLFRAYRADQGKWQTSDPLGYPDGWNNFAYVNNRVNDKSDSYGLCTTEVDNDGKVTIIPCGTPTTLYEEYNGTDTGYTGFMDIRCGFDGKLSLIPLPGPFSLTISYKYECSPSCTLHNGYKRVRFSYEVSYYQTTTLLYPCGRRTGDGQKNYGALVKTSEIYSKVIVCKE